jgi:hypothetical protein
MEEISKRVASGPKPGEIVPTKWFYERARGAYLNEKNKFSTKSEVSKFEKIFSEFNGSKNISSTLRDATTGYITFGLGFGVTPTNSLNSFNQIPLNGVLNGGDIFMGNMLYNEGWE